MKTALLPSIFLLSGSLLLFSSCDFTPLPGDEKAIKLGEIKKQEDKKANLPEATVDAQGNLILPSSLDGATTAAGTSALSPTVPMVESQMGVADGDNTYLYAVSGQELKAKVGFKTTKTDSGEQQDIASLTLIQGKNSYDLPPAALFAPQASHPELNALYQNLPATVFVRFQGNADSPLLKMTLFCGEGEQACDVSFIFLSGKLISRSIVQKGKETTITYP